MFWNLSFRGRDWTIGKPLGQGGFGAIYLVQLGEHKKVDDGAEYVVKVDKSFFLKWWRKYSWKATQSNSRLSLMTMVPCLWKSMLSSPSEGRNLWVLGSQGASMFLILLIFKENLGSYPVFQLSTFIIEFISHELYPGTPTSLKVGWESHLTKPMAPSSSTRSSCASWSSTGSLSPSTTSSFTSLTGLGRILTKFSKGGRSHSHYPQC